MGCDAKPQENSNKTSATYPRPLLPPVYGLEIPSFKKRYVWHTPGVCSEGLGGIFVEKNPPLRGTDTDLVVRVAALLRNLSSDIKAPLVPTWWFLILSFVAPDRGRLEIFFGEEYTPRKRTAGYPK